MSAVLATSAQTTLDLTLLAVLAVLAAVALFLIVAYHSRIPYPICSSSAARSSASCPGCPTG
jgi:hypothetical protein